LPSPLPASGEVAVRRRVSPARSAFVLCYKSPWGRGTGKAPTVHSRRRAWRRPVDKPGRNYPRAPPDQRSARRFATQDCIIASPSGSYPVCTTMAVNTLDPLQRKAATKEAGDLPHGYFRVVRLSARIRSSATGFFTSVGAAIFPAPRHNHPLRQGKPRPAIRAASPP
jgi:hypothetical protein